MAQGFQLGVKICIWHSSGELSLFHPADEILIRSGKPDQTVYRQGGSRAHAERRQRSGVTSQGRHVEVAEVVRGEERLLDVLRRFDSRRPKRLRSELHEPLVELVNRGGDIRLPEMRLVGVDPSRLHETSAFTAVVLPIVAATVLGRLTFELTRLWPLQTWGKGKDVANQNPKIKHRGQRSGAVNGYANANSSILYLPQHRDESSQVFLDQFPSL